MEGEADALAESLRMVADPGLVRFAYVEGEPAAVMGAFPDPYYALRPRWQWYGDSDLIRILRRRLGHRQGNGIYQRRRVGSRSYSDREKNHG